ncbi:alpha/beta hydrolase [Pedobacter metabolipauper]|uniref:Phospholipase/carboxylesterase n=1 Tax=Pedobacter metabolipauper TaxID=425513 RepID=A0A4R6SQA8_9SPHI|nr:dienelactone hydrolase family protein [Pedobacter metabolipauper]TDQ06352.1 phospholipase/carboxylesterase [Pedobacter metabolipauper]
MYTHIKDIVTAGVPVKDAGKALILLHGRGSSAEDIISLGKHLKLDNAAVFAPQATNSSWYPYSFLSPVAENQPALDSALSVLKELVAEIIESGIPANKIYFAGFSQGACLTLEYITRNAVQYGGVAAFTGGLIGKEINMNNYKGDFKQTPILITTSDPDPHVPLRRVEVTEGLLTKMNAKVNLKIYAGKAHSISQPEIDLSNTLIFNNA